MSWLKNVLHDVAEKLQLPSGEYNRRHSNEVRLLAVMPKDQDSHVLAQIAEKNKWTLEFATNREDAIELVKRRRFAVILCDRTLTLVSNWTDAIEELVSTAPCSSVILTSPVNNDHLWQDVISRGGYDVLTKPFQEERVIRSVRFASTDPKM